MDNNKNCPDVEEVGQIKMREPGQSFKPEVPMDTVSELIGRLYGFKPRDFQELPSYEDRNFFFKAELDGSNLHHTSINEHGYVMKILNSLQSSQPAIIEANHAFQGYLRARGIPSQLPVLNKDGKEFSLERVIVHKNGVTMESGPYIVRVLTFIPGDTFFNTPYVPGSFYNIGTFAGKLHKAAKAFRHPFFDTYKHIWSLSEVPALSEFLYAVKDADDIAVIKEVMEAFETEIKPRMKTFTEGVIHGDISEQNLIMEEVQDQQDVPREARVHCVSGILDFSHNAMSYYVFDVAITIAYISIECPDDRQTEVGGHYLAGYLKFSPLTDEELGCLKTLVCCRLCQSLVFGAHAYLQQPWNTYVLTTSRRGWPLLHKLWKMDKSELMGTWKTISSGYINGTTV